LYEFIIAHNSALFDSHRYFVLKGSENNKDRFFTGRRRATGFSTIPAYCLFTGTFGGEYSTHAV